MVIDNTETGVGDSFSGSFKEPGIVGGETLRSVKPRMTPRVDSTNRETYVQANPLNPPEEIWGGTPTRQFLQLVVPTLSILM